MTLRFCNMVTHTNLKIFYAIYDVKYPPQKLKIFKISSYVISWYFIRSVNQWNYSLTFGMKGSFILFVYVVFVFKTYFYDFFIYQGLNINTPNNNTIKPNNTPLSLFKITILNFLINSSAVLFLTFFGFRLTFL